MDLDCLVEMDITLLPNDVLLAVLEHLSVSELFSVRLVSRRFRDLCLHRDLWKSISLSGQSKGVRAALLLAPCLGELCLLPSHLGDVAPLMSRTSCVVYVLRIGSWTELGDITEDMITIVQKLSSLGGLRELSMRLSPDATDSSLEFVLLKTIISTKSLKALFITCKTPLTAGASFDSDLTASLTTLSLLRSSSVKSIPMNPFIDLMLRVHAATLETVILEVRDVPLTLLKGIPKLKSLACYPRDDLSQLLECPFLTSIDLLDFDYAPFPAGTVDFFQRASRLRSVSFAFPKEDSTAALLALAGSKAAQGVDTLNLFSTVTEDLMVLANNLDQFPSLESLTVPCCVTNDFLRAISPASLPRLATLTTNSQHDGSSCTHAWLHGPAVQSLLGKNPRLHLQLHEWTSISDDCSCVWCEWGCHKNLRGSILTDPLSEVQFSAHPKKDCLKPNSCVQVVTSPSLL